MPGVRIPLELEDKVSSRINKVADCFERVDRAVNRATRSMTASEILARRMNSQAVSAADRYAEQTSKMEDFTDSVNRFVTESQGMSGTLGEAARMAEEEASAMSSVAGKIDEAAQRAEEEGTAMSGAADRVAELADAHDKAGREAQEQERKTSRLVSAVKKLAGGAKSAVSGLLGFGKAQTPLDGVTKKLTRMAASVFTVSRLIRYMKDALEVAPDDIASSFIGLGNTIKTDFQRIFVSMLKAIQPGLDRLRAVLDSPGGQRFLLGLQRMAEAAGQAIGWLADKVGVLIDWIGNHWNVIMPTALTLLGLFAAKMLLAAGAALAMNWPLLLIVGAIAGVMYALKELWGSAEVAFGNIGGAIAVCGAFFDNFGILVENVCNAVGAAWDALTYNIALWADNMAKQVSAAFHEMAADVFDSLDQILDFVGSLPGVGPMGSIKRAFEANGVDFGAMFSGAASAARAQAQIERSGLNNNYKDVGAAFEGGWGKSGKTAFKDGWNDKAWKDGYEAGAGFGRAVDAIIDGFNPENLDKMALQDIKVSADAAAGSLGSLGGIGDSVSAIEKAVAMTDEDIKQLVDLAERRYVNNVNLTTQSPVIQISGQNTGNTAKDREALAEAIKIILLEERSSGSIRSTAMV